jgi:hypothetical protein
VICKKHTMTLRAARPSRDRVQLGVALQEGLWPQSVASVVAIDAPTRSPEDEWTRELDPADGGDDDDVVPTIRGLSGLGLALVMETVRAFNRLRVARPWNLLGGRSRGAQRERSAS